MKTSHKPKRNVIKIIITIFLVLLIIFSVLFVLERLQITNFLHSKKSTTNSQSINYSPPTKEQINAGVKQPDVQTNNDLGISITYIDTTVDPIKISNVISGAVSNSGTCILKLTKGSLAVTKTADTYALPNTSTCKGFEVNKSELSTGIWNVSLTVMINGKESSINDSFTLD